MSGKPWTEERKKQFSLSKIGKTLSAMHRTAIAMGQLGKKRHPEVGMKIREKHLARIGALQERFWKLIDQSREGCWEWQGRCDKDGYGIAPGKYSNKPERSSHRMSFHFSYGPIPDGMLVCHSCDNPPCCNPEHLFLGTHADNQKDSAAKNRKARKFGPANPMHGRGKEISKRKRSADGKFI